MDTKEWLQLAVSTNPDRPSLMQIHECAAADGYRMHIENDGEPCQCGDEKTHKGFDNVIGMIKDAPFAFAINKRFLMDALSGMDPDSDHHTILFFAKPGGKSPIVIQDVYAEQTAIIMPLDPGGITDEIDKPQDLPRVAPKIIERPLRYLLTEPE